MWGHGSNEYGQCGLSISEDEDDNNECSHVLKPVRVMLPTDAGRAVSVSAGYAHTVVRDEHGAVYTFGQNENGQLGLGCVMGLMWKQDIGRQKCWGEGYIKHRNDPWLTLRTVREVIVTRHHCDNF